MASTISKVSNTDVFCGGGGGSVVDPDSGSVRFQKFLAMLDDPILSM